MLNGKIIGMVVLNLEPSVVTFSEKCGTKFQIKCPKISEKCPNHITEKPLPTRV